MEVTRSAIKPPSETRARPKVYASFVQFSLLDPDTIRKFCEVVIDKPITKNTNQLEGTVYDERLGVTGNEKIRGKPKPCLVCGYSVKNCPGHFGRIELPEAVYDYGKLPYVKMIVCCVCEHCGECRVSESVYSKKMPPSLHRSARHKRLIHMCKSRKICPHSGCGLALSCYKIKDGKIIRQTVDGKLYDLTGAQAYEILLKISSSTMVMMGFNEDLSPNPVFWCESPIEEGDRTHLHATKPTAFIWSVLPVVPTCARPRVMGDKKWENDKIDDAYNGIINICVEINEYKATGVLPKRRKKKTDEEDDELTIDKLVLELERRVNSTIDNHKERNEIKYRKHPPHMGFAEKIEGKKGRINNAVMAKTNDFCARTVIISGATEVPSGWFGVPMEMMDKLTLLEAACDLNVDYLNALVSRGVVESIKDPSTGKVIMISAATKNWRVPNPRQIKTHDRVSRFLLHADTIIAGRQPTIRDGSCQGFDIMAVEGKAFKLPLAHTIATNADYDGDEMYIQILQDARARIEAKELMGMSKLIVSPQTNSPIMYLTQDSLVAVFVLSQTCDVPRDLVFDAVMSCTDFLKIGRRRLDPAAAANCVYRFIARPGKQVFYKQVSEMTETAVFAPYDGPNQYAYQKALRMAKNGCDVGNSKANHQERISFLRYLLEQPYPVQRRMLAPYLKVYGEDVLFPRARDYFDAYQPQPKNVKLCTTFGDSISRWQNLLSRAIEFPEFKNQIVTRDDIPTTPGTVDGRLLISFLLPPELFFEKKDGVNHVLVEKGVLRSGTLHKKICNALISTICLNISTQRACQFIGEAEQLSYHYITQESYSLGIEDCLIDPEARKQLELAVDEAKTKCTLIHKNEPNSSTRESKINFELNELIKQGVFLANEGMLKESKWNNVFEGMQKGEIDPKYVDLHGYSGVIDPSNPESMRRAKLLTKNAMNKLRECGAKGSTTNCCQISGLVGQQNISGQRPVPNIRNERGSCSHRFNDTSPESRGFVQSCFLLGLNPDEMFDHLRAAREGVVSTSLKTGDTGYCGKKMNKKLDGYSVWTDGSVRNVAGHILQFLYGGDGISCGKVCSFGYSATPLFCDILSLAKAYATLWIEKSRALRVRLMMLGLRRRGALSYLPNEIWAKIFDLASTRHHTSCKKIPREVIEGMLSKFYIGQPGVQTKIQYLSSRNLRSILRPIFEKIMMPTSQIKPFLQDLVERFEKSKVAYGEMAGLSAGLSCSEPTMQLTLSSFHNTGLGDKDVSVGGVPRLKELHGANQCPSVPVCSFSISMPELEEEIKNLESQTPKPKEAIKRLRIRLLTECEKFGREIESLQLKDLCSSDTIKLFTPRGVKPVIEGFPFDYITPEPWKEEWWARFFFLINQGSTCLEIPKERCWVVEFTLSLGSMHRYQLQLEQIKDVLMDTYEDDDFVRILEIFVSPNIDHKIQVFFSSDQLMMTSFGKMPAGTMRNHDYFVCKQIMVPLLLNTKISGWSSVGKTFVRKTPTGYTIDAKGRSFQELLRHPDEPVGVTSNNMWDIYSTLGVEATRCYLMEEFTKIISFDATYVNPHHIEMLVDSMLVHGQISSVKSAGIGREVGPLAKGLFEGNAKEMRYAGAVAESDPLQSVASTVMFGMPSMIGTGAVNLVKKLGESSVQV